MIVAHYSREEPTDELYAHIIYYSYLRTIKELVYQTDCYLFILSGLHLPAPGRNPSMST